jgi:hypothetical protein
VRSSLVCVSHWLVLMLYTGQVYYGGKWTAAGVVAALSALPPHTRQALLRRADADARGTNQIPFPAPPIVSHVTPPFVPF